MLPSKARRYWSPGLLWLALCSGFWSCSSPPPPPKPPSPNAKWSCAPSGPERCADGLDNNCNGLADEGCGQSSGLVQFLIAWSDDTDLDLEVTDPTGSPARVGVVSSAGLLKDRDCPGRDERRCRGVNVENVVLAANREVQHGEYVIVVRLAPRQEPAQPVEVNLSARLVERVFERTFSVSKETPQRTFTLRL